MEKPIALFVTDWHLRHDNVDAVTDVITEACETATALKINNIIIPGDVFDSRPGQKQDTLVGLDGILGLAKQYDLNFHLIPGNHDKQDYSSYKSYLTPYRHYPNVRLYERMGMVPIDKVCFHLLPFFQEEMWREKLGELIEHMEFGDNEYGKDKSFKHILVSHQAVNGSVNNDGSKVACNIGHTDFLKFELVILGHYHDQQQPLPNVMHIPSAMQRNFGENDNKGFTIVYKDGNKITTKLIKSTFKPYRKIVINVDEIMSAKDMDDLIKKHATKDAFIRFEFVGDQAKIKALPQELFTDAGIDVKVKINELEDTIKYAEVAIKEYDKDSIVEEFKIFCSEKSKNFEEGIVYLQKRLGITPKT